MADQYRQVSSHQQSWSDSSQPSWIAEVDYNGEDRENNRDDAYDKNDYERMDPNKLSPQAESFHDNVAKVLVLSTRVWPDVITCKEKAAS